MKHFALAVLIGLAGATVSQAAVKAVPGFEARGIPNSTTYTITGAGRGKTSALEIAQEVGKRIRQAIHRKSIAIEGYSFQKIRLETAIEELGSSEGEFEGLTEKELAVVRSWHEDRRVAAVYRMPIETSYMGGTGMETHFIFVPADAKADPALSIEMFWYAE